MIACCSKCGCGLCRFIPVRVEELNIGYIDGMLCAPPTKRGFCEGLSVLLGFVEGYHPPPTVACIALLMMLLQCA